MPVTFDDAVEPNIVFEGIRADDVIVVRIRKPDRNPGGAIDLARDRLEVDGDSDIRRSFTVVDREREPVVDRVGADLGQRVTTWCARIREDGPGDGLAPAGQAHAEAGRECAKAELPKFDRHDFIRLAR